MIVTSGGRFAGYALYLLESRPVFTWNMLNLQRITWEGEALAPGKHTIEFDFRYDGLGAGTLAFGSPSGLGQGGTGTLTVDGTVVDTKTMQNSIPNTLQWDEPFDIGSDTLTGIHDDHYTPPFQLTAALEKLTIKVDRPQLTEADIRQLQDALHRASD
jgi:arylsulfatase